ncbi:syntabulin isoform X2 [Ambystoma mexicanum]|uniref:syntabulin isoform X2 n=1 Tax=Ambystoma mexicanum TaxID=8296 RepID=UPI0037E9957E
MGRLQGSRASGEQHKAPDKEVSARSRIPRLVLRPYLPRQKASPSSESPFSEEESKDFQPDHGGSATTPSSNSFCSDDTGCPSSQSVSPVKTPSDAGNSPLGFHTVSEEEYARTKLCPAASGDGNAQSVRHKKEQKACLAKPGSDADFSSSSSTGSISAPEVHMSATPAATAAAGSKSRSSHGRGTACCSSLKTGTSPPASREKDLMMLGRNPISPVNNSESYGASSASSSNSGSYKGSETSPTLRRTTRYNSCGDNHGIKPPNPEQYLTPLQQKEVTIRHLKTKLKESESRLHERENEIEDLKSQLARMREDWIEEECHRVEAQLALKEARKEIKQLKQFIETMKNSLEEKDKGIQKYFIDINIQNKKLESLLHNMEMAQNGSAGDEQSLEFLCESPGKSVTESTMYGKMVEEEDQAIEEMADSGLLLNDDMANKTLLDDVLMAATSEQDSSALLHSSAVHTRPVHNSFAKIPTDQKTCALVESTLLMEQAIQTDVVPYSLDVEKLVLTIFKSHYSNPVISPSALWVAGGLHVECVAESAPTLMLDLTPNDPNSAILLSPADSPCGKIFSKANGNRAMKELDFEVSPEQQSESYTSLPEGVIVQKYWSDSLLVDILAIAVPIIPTIMWAFSTQRGAIDPLYNMGTLLRGCCLMGLHSLRRTPFNLGNISPNLH